MGIVNELYNLYTRRGLKENIQFNTIALSSLAENYSQIFSLYKGKDIDNDWFDEYDKKHFSLENKLIKMNKVIIEKIDKKEWKDDYILYGNEINDTI